MFRCYFCQQITPPRTTRHSVVIEMREKQYSTRRRESKRRGFRSRDEDIQDRGGKGIEITREVDACPKCAAKEHEVTTVTNESPELTEQSALAEHDRDSSDSSRSESRRSDNA